MDLNIVLCYKGSYFFLSITMSIW